MPDAPGQETATKPSLVWFKAQAPGIRHDGSSLVTLRLAGELSKDFNVHLVCLRTPATAVDEATVCTPPFASVTVASTPHQRSPAHRLILGGWYHVLNGLGIRPMASSIEGAKSVKQAVAQRVRDVGATAGVVEYWSSGRVLDAMPMGKATLIVLDVEHLSVERRNDREQRMILNEELAVCARADKVVFLSNEDHAAFAAQGVSNGETVLLPAAAAPSSDDADRSDTTVVFLGDLNWGPNKRGLTWLLDNVWPIVHSECPDAKLLVVGSGPTEQYGENDSVIFAGFVDDLQAVLQTATVAVAPTLDGTGVKTKTIEFLAARLPVVSTSSGVRGTSGSEAGAIIEDDPIGFADAIASLLADLEMRSRVVREGQEALLAHHSALDLAERLLP